MALKTILIVEDDADIYETLEELFQGEGYSVLHAKNGLDAIELLGLSTTSRPCLMFVDLMMPVMDGVTFLLELERKFPVLFKEVPTYIMSARADTHLLTVQTTGVLTKPFDLDELTRVAAKYCE